MNGLLIYFIMTSAVVYVEQYIVMVVQSCELILTYNMETVNNDDNASVG